jgi:hypothetical protein
MPPQGGGGGGMAGAMVQKLQQLMQDPVASQAIMQKAQQMGLGGGGGGDPRARMAAQGVTEQGGFMPRGMQGQDSAGPATDGDLEAMMAQAQGMRPDIPPGPERGMMGERMDMMDDPRQTPMPPDGDSPETRMINQEIDRKGATFDGVDAPTQNDIDRLIEAPTDSMVEAFDAEFGDGAARQYINPGVKVRPIPGADPDDQAQFEEDPDQ